MIIMTETKIKIEGMMCGHCQASATKAISSVSGVSSVKVSLADKEATVTYDPKKTNVDAIKAAIVEAGYQA
jgi:copper ion binding protein